MVVDVGVNVTPAGAVMPVALIVIVAAPLPTVKLEPLNVPLPEDLVYPVPVYPLLRVGVIVVKSTVAPYSKVLVMDAVPVFVQPVAATLLTPRPTLTVIVNVRFPEHPVKVPLAVAGVPVAVNDVVESEPPVLLYPVEHVTVYEHWLLLFVDAAPIVLFAPAVHAHAEHAYDLSAAVKPVRTYLFSQVAILQRFDTLFGFDDQDGVSHDETYDAPVFVHATLHAVYGSAL